MDIAAFEHGKTRIMTEARDTLLRLGCDRHSLLFDLHRTNPPPEGATLTVSTEGGTVEAWFSSQEIRDSQERVGRADVRQKIASLVDRLTQAVA